MYYLYKKCNINNWPSYNLIQKLIVVLFLKNKIQVIRIFILIQNFYSFYSSWNGKF